MDIMFVSEPVFDPHEQLVGHEFSCWVEPGRAREEAEQAATGTLLDLGFDPRAGDELLYLRVTPAMLRSPALAWADPQRVVLMLDGEPGSPDALEACSDLARRGFRFGIDRASLRGTTDSVLRLLHVVKIDVRSVVEVEDLQRALDQLRPYPIQVVATGVDGTPRRNLCAQLGIRLFQGYDFSVPEGGGGLPVESLDLLQLLRELRNPDSSDSVLVESFRRNVALTYRLLLLVNSAAIGGRHVASVGHAIRMLGRGSLYRWLAHLLVDPTNAKGMGAALRMNALRRGRMCELLAGSTGRSEAADSLFLIGLFSQLELLLGIPMGQLVDELAVPPDMREALLYRAGDGGAVLALVDAYDRAAWAEVHRGCQNLRISPGSLAEIYLESLGWARKRRPSMV